MDPPFLTLALDGSEYVASRMAALTTRTHWIGGWLAYSVWLKTMEQENSPLPGIKSRPSNP
jgi:hypothetical protein